MKKTICVAIVLAVIFVCTFIGVRIYINSDLYEANNKESSRYGRGWLQGEYAAYFVREKLPTDIIWYGEYHYYEDYELPVRFETEINDDVLKIRSGYEKAIIFINDLDGNLNFDEEDYKLILRHIEYNTRYNFVYVGTKDLSYIYELFGYDPANLEDDEVELIFLNLNDSIQCFRGGYKSEDLDDKERIGYVPLQVYADMFDDE